MYEWSKGVMKKISDSGCLDEKELRMVEVALRTSEIYDYIINECIGLTDDNKYELQHKIPSPEKRGDTNGKE